MAGFFDSLFDEGEPTGFFGGYRPRNAPAPTDAAGLALPAGDAAAAAQPAMSAEPADVLTYPDGTPVTDPKGNPYPRPPGLDVQKNLDVGNQINEQFQSANEEGFPVSRDLLFAPFFPAGAIMDYKRPDGIRGPVEKQFRPASYYNYGVMAAKVGYGRDEALRNAGLYNRVAGGAYLGANAVNSLRGHPPTFDNPYGLDGQDAVDYIGQGYDDYQNGRWAPTQSNQ